MPRTLFELLPLLSDVEFIIAVDGAICFHEAGYRAGIPPLCTLQQLWEFAERQAGRRGIRRFRQLLEEGRVGSDSAQESRLRLTLEEHGIQELEPGVVVLDENGDVAFQSDLGIKGAKLSIQYDSRLHHHDAAQIDRDMERTRRTEAVGWAETRVGSRDFRRGAKFRGMIFPACVVAVLTALERKGLLEQYWIPPERIRLNR